MIRVEKGDKKSGSGLTSQSAKNSGGGQGRPQAHSEYTHGKGSGNVERTSVEGGCHHGLSDGRRARETEDQTMTR